MLRKKRHRILPGLQYTNDNSAQAMARGGTDCSPAVAQDSRPVQDSGKVLGHSIKLCLGYRVDSRGSRVEAHLRW